MNYQQRDIDFEVWSDRSTIADCLRVMGLDIMADKAMDLSTSQELISEFLNIIKREAQVARRHDVLEQLYSANLVQG